VLGIAAGRVSPGALEILCRMGTIEEFRSAAVDAMRMGNIPISAERLRRVVEAEAERVRRTRDSGRLAAVWSAEKAKVSPQGPTRVYVGADGVMVSAVTQAEKDKRRRQQEIRRKEREKTGVGNRQPLPPPRPGHDEYSKEIKIGVFYDAAKEHKQVFATEGKPEAFGALLKQHGLLIGFAKAAETLGLADGAKWIVNQFFAVFLSLHAMLLDFFHFAEHMHEAARICLGETEAARQWATARLEEAKHQGVSAVLEAIAALQKKMRSARKLESLRKLREYIEPRREMMDYPAALAKGWDIGSGPTEAECKSLTLRLKRPGMKWDPDHAAGIMNLKAMYESGQARDYWRQRRRAA